MDTILFSLLILRGLCDSQGRVWRCDPHQYYAIEVTLPLSEITRKPNSLPTFSIRGCGLIELLPYVLCLSPREILKYLSEKHLGKGVIGMCTMYIDVYEYFESRVYPLLMS